MNDTVETRKCSNCKLDILYNNFIIHSIHCQRNFYLCSKCQQPVNLNQKIEHDEANHVVIHCKHCHVQLEKYCLTDHLIHDCPCRKINCQVCDMEVKASDITEHENYCGSRTEKCQECGEYVMLKYKALHIDSNHTFIKLLDEPGPSPSWQYGRRTLHNFMPDLTSHQFKVLPNQKKKSSENQKKKSKLLPTHKNNEDKIIQVKQSDTKSTHLNPTDLNQDHLHRSPNGMVRNLYLDLSNTEEAASDELVYDGQIKDKKLQKLSKKGVEDCSPGSNLTPFHLSCNMQDGSVKSKAVNSSPSQIDEEADFLYAFQVSQELNSHIWNKESAADKGMDKNYFRSDEESSKSGNSVQKKILSSKNKTKVNSEATVNFHNDSVNDYFFNSDKLNHRYNIEDVKLPCEFCGIMVLSEDLILHQNRCDTFMKKNMNLKPDSLKNKDTELCCEICNKLFKISLLEDHQTYCNKNISKTWENWEKANCVENIKFKDVKTETHHSQNGVDHCCSVVSNMETHSEPLSDLSKDNCKEERDLKNNMTNPKNKVAPKSMKLSRKNRRAPSPPKM